MEDTNNSECLVCFQIKSLVSDKYKCLHCFCEECYNKWHEESNTCPICRSVEESTNDNSVISGNASQLLWDDNYSSDDETYCNDSEWTACLYESRLATVWANCETVEFLDEFSDDERLDD